MSLKIVLNFETDTRQCIKSFSFLALIPNLKAQNWFCGGQEHGGCKGFSWRLDFQPALEWAFTGWCLGSAWVVQEFSMKQSLPAEPFSLELWPAFFRSKAEDWGTFRKEQSLEVEQCLGAHLSQRLSVYCQLLWKFRVWGVLMFPAFIVEI